MNTVIIYFVIESLFLIAMSVYDLKHLKLSMKAYYLFIPIALFSIYPNLILHNFDIAYVLTISIVVAIILYSVFFVVSLVSNGGLGGGDVKLFLLLGFIYGAKSVELLGMIAMATIIISSPIYIYKKHKNKHGFKIKADNKNELSQEEKIELIITKITENTNIAYIPIITLGAIGTNIYMVTSFIN